MRGIWNLVSNYNVFNMFPMSGRRKPINKLRLGQVHTLHDASGKIVEPVYRDYWYDPNYIYEERSNLTSSSWQVIRSEARRINRKIQRSGYASDLVRAVVRYGRALDNVDFEAVFLKLWSLLEFLTCSRDNYKLLGRRVAFLFEDSTLVNHILKHLRDRRNNFVHSAAETNRTKSLVFEIKPFVERILQFHITGAAKFKSREDAASYLDLPKNPEEIRNRIKRHHMALAFRTPRAPTDI